MLLCLKNDSCIRGEFLHLSVMLLCIIWGYRAGNCRPIVRHLHHYHHSLTHFPLHSCRQSATKVPVSCCMGQTAIGTFAGAMIIIWLIFSDPPSTTPALCKVTVFGTLSAILLALWPTYYNCFSCWHETFFKLNWKHFFCAWLFCCEF